MGRTPTASRSRAIKGLLHLLYLKGTLPSTKLDAEWRLVVCRMVVARLVAAEWAVVLEDRLVLVEMAVAKAVAMAVMGVRY